jgi:hypothetical protein
MYRFLGLLYVSRFVLLLPYRFPYTSFFFFLKFFLISKFPISSPYFKFTSSVSVPKRVEVTTVAS